MARWCCSSCIKSCDRISSGTSYFKERLSRLFIDSRYLLFGEIELSIEDLGEAMPAIMGGPPKFTAYEPLVM